MTMADLVLHPERKRAIWWLSGAVLHWVGVAVVAVLLWIVPATTSEFFTGQLGRFLVFGLAALGLDLIWGYMGQLSLGHAAFFGVGAYAAGLILAKTEWPALGLVAIAAGILLPAFVAFVMGRVLFYGNVVGAYFAIVTLLVSLILEQTAISTIHLTGGINGLYGMKPLTLGPFAVDDLFTAYYFIVICCVLSYILCRILVLSPLGRAMDGVRTNERRVASLGYSTVAIRTLVFTIGGALAGLAGVLYVPLEAFVYPTQLGVAFSTSIIVWLAIGGRRSLVGAFIGAFIINYGQSTLADRYQEYWVLATGVFLVVVVLTQPRGLLGAIEAAARFVRRLVQGRASHA
jgi:urea transport system permease protein